MNLNDYQRQLDESPIVPHRISAPDTDVAFTLQYAPVNGEAGTSTAATIALVQAGSMTFLVDAAAPTGKDAIGTAGVINTGAAAFDTVGELGDYVNSLGGRTHGAWRFIIRGALRADTMSTILAKTAASAIGANGLDFYSDTSASETISQVISAERFVNNGVNGYQSDWEHKVLNQLMSFAVTQDMASNGQVLLYEGRDGVTETLLHTLTLTDDTALSKGIDYPAVVWDQARHGYRYIVRTSHATDIGAGAVTDNIVRGRSIVPDGAFIVAV
ncbi:hypothetical protein LCGC14_1601150 [marine sediment metagenome]|uniref:Uncharacterized protein n=1 Tax=marine sediment metagenome TaxID=412755 RepID=A0A0F9LB69_9ZZZZ